MQIKILALCGSSRRDSLNQKLLDMRLWARLPPAPRYRGYAGSISHY
jgi:hypothetical protein